MEHDTDIYVYIMLYLMYAIPDSGLEVERLDIHNMHIYMHIVCEHDTDIYIYIYMHIVCEGRLDMHNDHPHVYTTHI